MERANKTAAVSSRASAVNLRAGGAWRPGSCGKSHNGIVTAFTMSWLSSPGASSRTSSSRDHVVDEVTQKPEPPPPAAMEPNAVIGWRFDHSKHAKSRERRTASKTILFSRSSSTTHDQSKSQTCALLLRFSWSDNHEIIRLAHRDGSFRTTKPQVSGTACVAQAAGGEGVCRCCIEV